MLRIPCTEYKRNDKVLASMEIRKMKLNTRKRQLKYLGYITSIGGLETVVLTRQIQGTADNNT